MANLHSLGRELLTHISIELTPEQEAIAIHRFVEKVRMGLLEVLSDAAMEAASDKTV